MKIIKPSATIIEDELAKLSIHQRIDYVASICYQRPPKPTEEEAQEFCRKMLSVKHGTTLEMNRIHLIVENASKDDLENLQAKYINITEIKDYRLLISGSIRAFIDWFNCDLHYYGDAMEGCCIYLSKNFPLFFNKPDGIYTSYVRCNVREALPEEIPWQHKYVAARFIVNRAVSHELVRHRPCTFLQESQRYCRYDDDVVFIEPEWLEYRNETDRLVWEDTMDILEGTYQSMMQNGLKPQQARAVLPNSTKTELICYASLPQWKHMFDLRCSPAADPEMRRVMIPLREEFKEKYKEVEW